MSERFFSSQRITGDHAMLDGPEAHHLLHVMRARVGDKVTLFDDSGAEFAAAVESLGRSEATVRVLERCEIDRELPFPLTVGVALPKSDRQKWLVEKLTELGITELVPLTTERGVAQPTASALDRLRRSVVEAAKQCGRNRLMHVVEPLAWNEWIDRASPRRLLAHPGGARLSQVDVNTTVATQIAVGPEGGLTDAEVATAIDAGWQTVDLGSRILRVETAAIALAAAIALR
jgi:16S rRNA (uracil1498-N3)-methyltransferase